MGCFSYVCCVSGLPIGAGDPVRFLLFNEGPYHRGDDVTKFTCEMHDRWVPRTLPIKAFYNDYGSIERAQEGPLRDCWLAGFQEDLFERGVGDNQCHDVAVKKNMTFDELLNALWEGRVRVFREGRLGKDVPVPPRGCPTMDVVEARLQKAGLPVARSFGQGYFVDEEGPYTLRIRWQGSGTDWNAYERKLTTLLPLLSDFAVMLCQVDREPQLTVRPKPVTEDYSPYHAGVLRDAETLAVGHGMIREDVWQALVHMEFHSDWPSRDRTLADCRRAAEEALGDVPPQLDPEVALLLPASRLPPLHIRAVPLEHLGLGGNVPFLQGVSEHMVLALDRGASRDELAEVASEFAYISQILSYVGFLWRPSSSSGPQIPHWASHVALHRALLAVAEKAEKEEREDE